MTFVYVANTATITYASEVKHDITNGNKVKGLIKGETTGLIIQTNPMLWYIKRIVPLGTILLGTHSIGLEFQIRMFEHENFPLSRGFPAFKRRCRRYGRWGIRHTFSLSTYHKVGAMYYSLEYSLSICFLSVSLLIGPFDEYGYLLNGITSRPTRGPSKFHRF